MPLYHVQVHMPKLEFPRGEFKLTYSEHAIRASKDDRFGSMTLPTSIHTSMCRIVEVETSNSYPDAITKILYKTRLDRDRDLVLAVIPGTVMHVKTVWINQKNDRHSTLDRSRYSTR